MKKQSILVCLVSLVVNFFMTLGVYAQNAQSADMDDVNYKLGQMSLENESLKRDIAELKRNLVYLQTEQKRIQQELRDNDKGFKDQLDAQRTDIVTQVSRQIQKLAAQTQAAIDGLGKQVSVRSVEKKRSFDTNSADFPKDGFEYTVQPGDTLSKIAEKYNSNVNSLQQANQIDNPKGLRSGDKLFIPSKQ